jgi:hydrogenase maturation protease
LRIVAFAMGNAVRADDGVGRALARGLEKLLPQIEVVEVQELLPEHAERVADADGVLFLDASVSGRPGEVHAERIGPRPARAAVIHALMPEEVLGLARSLHGRAPPAAMITVSGRDFAWGEALSDEVEAALPLAREKARELAEGFARQGGPVRVF